jgi:environmental stress-induced protein Ves
MRVLRAADRRAVPWKNGGGVTREVVASPGADGFSFDWRLSIAEVNAGGPFSLFPGVDRSLAVLEGRMRLTVGDGSPIELDSDAEALAFPGDVPTSAELIRPVIDLNLMTRREGFRGRLTKLPGGERVQLRGDVAVVVALGGMGLRATELGRLDAVMIEGQDELPPLGAIAWLAELFAP